MNTAEQNLLLLQEIEANRKFILMAYAHNPNLLKNAEPRIKQLFDAPAHGLSAYQQEGEGKTFSQRGMGKLGEKQRGISLIELIMFIVIVSVALAGILLVMNTTTRNSADPLIHKQALAIAESMLEEVELMPFTICDPNDVNAATAVLGTDCTAGLDQNKGGGVLTTPTPASENRWSATDPFDNVADYGGFTMGPGICDITNTTPTCTTPIAGLGGYTAAVNVIRVGTALGLASNELALQITVTVTGPDNVPVVVDGIRTRYSPNI